MGETDYFEREFMERFKPEISPARWREEREALAETLSGLPTVFMHRDFQSRNIIIKDNRPRLIDFQTAYLGPLLYDTASLLRDPYLSLPEERVELLLKYCYSRLAAENAIYRLEYGEFKALFNAAGIQRNLQALAAYARLGLGDGKKGFLRSIRPALELLERGAADYGSCPEIRKMAASCLDEITEEGLIELYRQAHPD
jgi:hypothetical protein